MNFSVGHLFVESTELLKGAVKTPRCPFVSADASHQMAEFRENGYKTNNFTGRLGQRVGNPRAGSPTENLNLDPTRRGGAEYQREEPALRGKA